MLNNIIILKYIPIKSPIHQMNSVTKILCLIIYLITLIFCNSLISLSLIAILCLLTILLSKIDLKIYLKNILSLKYILLFLLVITFIFNSNIIITLITIGKLILIVLNAMILTLTTKPKEITNGFEVLLYPFKILKLPIKKISASISLALQFIPMILLEANKILTSMASRGIDYYHSKIKDKVIALKAMIIPLFVLTLKRADEVSETMEVRMYDINDTKNKYNINFNYYDIFIITIYLGILILFIIKEAII